MPHHHHNDEHCHDIFSRWMDERNHYFTGKYLTAKDFQDEQAYTIAHHRWHQWGLHGYGIVWGLEVDVEPDGCIRVEPGVAIDCWGRELVLTRPVQFAATEMPHLLRHDSHEGQEHVADQPAEDANKEILLGLLFQTRDRDCVPVILNDHHPGQQKVHGRVKEYAKIGFTDFCDRCWSIPKPFQNVDLPELPRDQREPIGIHQHNCADEHCACNPDAIVWPACQCGQTGFLPLAKLTRENHAWKAYDSSRRYVPSPFFAEQLTHIIGVSWYHDGTTQLTDILCNAEAMHPKHRHAFIKILFDRPLATGDDSRLAQLIQLTWNPVDENDCDGDDQPEVVNVSEAVLNQDRTVLHIEFPYQRLWRYEYVRLRLSLNCEMLVDYRGRAVDGEHLHGQVPYWHEGAAVGGRSGDGREGGVFQSWTRISKN